MVRAVVPVAGAREGELVALVVLGVRMVVAGRAVETAAEMGGRTLRSHSSSSYKMHR